MISTAPLYNPKTHRYKGVYPWKNYWRAIVQSPDGKQVFLGYFPEQDIAARAVATYYYKSYGEQWAQALKDRMRRNWRIKKFVRYPYMKDLHRGPSVTVYVAEVKVGSQWHKVVPTDITDKVDMSGDGAERLWNESGQGWSTSAAALVAIRLYRIISPDREPSPV